MKETGNYTVIAEFGRTSRADLYTGTRTRDGLPVMLKNYRVPAGTAPTFHQKYVERFRQECQWHQSILHPNVVETIDVMVGDDADESPVLVMERLGDSLHTVYATNRDVSLEEIVAWLAHVLAGVRALHERGIVHRDLKPDNILLNEHGVPKLIDLSIAIEMGNPMTLLPDDISTQYAAPEMYLEGDATSFGTDVYSVGILFYQLLCGVNAFNEEFANVISNNERQTNLRWMHWHNDADATLTPLNEIQPAIPDRLANVIAKMTEKRIELRYLSVDDVFEDLLDAAAQIGGPLMDIVRRIAEKDAPDAALSVVSAALVGSTMIERGGPPPAKKSSKRNLLIAGGVSASLLVMIVAIVGVLAMNAGRTTKTIHGLYEQAVIAYSKSEYPTARDYAQQGREYAAREGVEEKFGRVIELLTVIEADSHWMESIESDLAAAGTAIAALEFDGIEESLQAILDASLEQEERNTLLFEMTGEKLADHQSRAEELLAKLRDARARALEDFDAYTSAIEKGRYRQAHVIAQTADAVPSNLRDDVAGVAAIVKTLDRARTLYDEKKFVAAREAFSEASEASDGQSVEAEYFLQKIALGPAARLLPALSLNPAAIASEDLEIRLVAAMAQVAAFFGKKYDLEQSEADDAEAARVRGAADLLVQELTRNVGDGEFRFESSEAFLDSVNMAYPPAESAEYYRMLLADLVQILFLVDIQSEDFGAAGALLQESRDALLPQDMAYFSARLQEQTLDASTYAAGVQTYEEILKTYPEWADCSFRKGLLLYRLGDDIDGALSAIRRAAELAPGNERYRWWGARFADEHAALQLKAGQYDAAIAYCELARAFWPDFPASYFTQAMIGWDREDLDYTSRHLDLFALSVEDRKYAYSTEDEYAEMAARIRQEIARASGR